MGRAEPDTPAITGQPTLQVTVAWSARPREVRQLPLELPAGSTVADAVQAAAAIWLADGLPADGWVAARWGRKLGPDSALRAGDRIELCRGLQVDPKEARRLRYQAQGPRRRQPTRGAGQVRRSKDDV